MYSVEKSGIYYTYEIGRLANLAYGDRATYQRAHSYYGCSSKRLLHRHKPPQYEAMLAQGSSKAPADSSLLDCLLGCKVDTLKRLASAICVTIPSTLRKANLASLLAQEFPTTIARLNECLMLLTQSETELVQQAIGGAHIPISTSILDDPHSFLSAFPYLFVCMKDGLQVWSMPKELRVNIPRHSRGL